MARGGGGGPKTELDGNIAERRPRAQDAMTGRDSKEQAEAHRGETRLEDVWRGEVWPGTGGGWEVDNAHPKLDVGRSGGIGRLREDDGAQGGHRMFFFFNTRGPEREKQAVQEGTAGRTGNAGRKQARPAVPWLITKCVCSLPV